MTRSEAETREQLIDKQLASAGWDINNPLHVIKEYTIHADLNGQDSKGTPPSGRGEFCDYVLLGKDGKPLAVIEAKRTCKDAEIGREQAKQYCYHIQRYIGGELPFCFYTNGLDYFFGI